MEGEAHKGASEDRGGSAKVRALRSRGGSLEEHGSKVQRKGCWENGSALL